MKRRSFLSILGLASIYPTSKVLNNLYDYSFTKKVSSAPKKYVLFNIMEAPARWMFDSILMPTKNHEFISHRLIPTDFKEMKHGPFNFEYQYTFTEVKGYQFPQMWNYDMPSSSGKNIPLKNLAENMLIVRGCDMVLDGHEICSRKLEAPMAGEFSISGLHDHRTSPLFGCLCLEGTKQAGTAPQAYSSPSRSSTIISREKNYAEYLLDPFINNEKDSDLESILNETLKDETNTNLVKLFNSRKIKKKSLENLKGKIDQIIKEYNDNVIKYQSLIDRSIQKTNLKGITDKAISGLEFPITLDRKYHRDGAEYEIEDYLGTYKEIDQFILAKDMRDLFDRAEIREFAKQLALTEVSLKHDLSNSIIINIDAVTNLQTNIVRVDEVKHKKEGDKVTFYIDKNTKIEKLGLFHDADSHKTGSLPTLITDTLFFRAVASCIEEMKQSLKAHSPELWNNTLLHLSTEFEREPGEIDKGSHHGITGHTSTFFSGAIEKTEVIGNIYTISHDQTDVFPGCGTWGKGAPVKGLNDRVMVYGNIASSITNFLECESPVPHERPIFELNHKGKIVSRIETPENKPYNIKSLKTERPQS
jgi:hypothetical protein